VASVQLDHFEVVASTNVPGLDLVGTGDSFHGVVLDLIIGQSNTQGAVHVAQTGSDTLVVGIVETVVVKGLTSGGVEGVTNAELEAGEVRGLVHDHVAPACGRSSAEGVGHASLAECVSKRVGDASEVLGSDVGLTTEVQTAPCVALQTQGGVTTEQTIALARVAVTQRETGFDLENSLQTVAQVF